MPRDSSTALIPLPDWWPKETVYHGTTWERFRNIQRQGLCAPVAHSASGDDYGWREVWRHEIYADYKSLTAEQRKKLHARLGLSSSRPMSQIMLGDSVSLWWVSKDRKVAEGYEAVMTVDLSKLDYYWWLPDDVLGGKSSYVFVLPTNCPQAPASILKPYAYPPPAPGRYAYVPLRQWLWAGGSGPVENFGLVGTQNEALDSESVFFGTEAGAYRHGTPIARFPWPKGARLLDARTNTWAVKGAITPRPGWEWFEDRLFADRPTPFVPMPMVRS